MFNMADKIELSVVLPCRNEEKSLDFCIKQIKKVLEENKINGEIIVSDSSSDKSPEIAKKNKIKLVKHGLEGYGVAYLEGFKEVRGKYIFMADSDGSYDFNEIPRFLKVLRQGYDFVIGDRLKGKMEKGSMPWSHQYIGNPILSGILRVFFNSNVHDVHCGMRAISKEALDNLNLRTTGMEFASEMVIKAIKRKLKIKQLPIDYHKRKGKSKLRPFSDAWKHMRFMLLYSPLFLFFIPGMLLFFVGFLSMIWFYLGNPHIFTMNLQVHPMFISSLLTLIGYQLIVFAAFAKSYAINHLGEESEIMQKLYRYITIEKASIIGIILGLFGIAIYIFILIKWIRSNFGSLDEVKNSIVALTLIVLGIQTVFSSFMLSILGIKEK
jgi:glycosyltransferase involved in cell wall biosynthesis